MKFDLVIQGPLNQTSLDKLNELSQEFENVIVSHWDCDDFQYSAVARDNIVVISQPLPDREKTYGVMKNSTFYYSICSTFLGLQCCESEYTIKMRSDEIYSNFTVLKERLMENSEKFVFGNIFAKPWTHSPYHIGDHLFAAKTEHLYNSYKILFDSYTFGSNLMENPWIIQGFPSDNTAESILAKSFLHAKEINKNLWSFKSTLVKNFDVVDINDLGDYTAKWVHGFKTYSSNNNRYECSIANIGDF